MGVEQTFHGHFPVDAAGATQWRTQWRRGGAPCTPGRHRVGCRPDIPFVHDQLTTLGRWGHRDAAHCAKESRLVAVICSRAHVAVREQRMQWLALMVR
ncbi:hypothetical protein HaLaN_04285 [Haematococcus lacustris]|uniref:Uncharacterized protein n=1 Tax=Haematococcus lacustris TaxID=44745 RepID=A0A699YIW5_HAELA|nr:hypothetical protein HaLaN_04285 [Haematococcus lacustris]